MDRTSIKILTDRGINNSEAPEDDLGELLEQRRRELKYRIYVNKLNN